MPTTLEESKIYDPYEAYLDRIAGDRFKYNRLHDSLKELPDNLLDFLFDPRTADFIKEKVSLPLELTPGQSRELAIIVLEIVLADFYLGDIVDKIKERLRVDDEKAKKILNLVVLELMSEILEDLKKRHADKFLGGQEIPQQKSPEEDRTIDLRNIQL